MAESVQKTLIGEISAYITKDKSQIKELMHPDKNGCIHQSLAEATVFPGDKTQLHKHSKTEELYHLTQGMGLMTLAENTFNVKVGDTVLVPPGTAHCIENTSEEPLKILCCCSPPYSHDDTEILDHD
jgi:mannose-6-phosphate isomerase-like protein (cupin superfamily)